MENKIKIFLLVKHVPIKTQRTEQGENFNFSPAFYRNESKKDVLASECVPHVHVMETRKGKERGKK
jgi:hypothetical protein